MLFTPGALLCSLPGARQTPPSPFRDPRSTVEMPAGSCSPRPQLCEPGSPCPNNKHRLCAGPARTEPEGMQPQTGGALNRQAGAAEALFLALCIHKPSPKSQAQLLDVLPLFPSLPFSELQTTRPGMQRCLPGQACSLGIKQSAAPWDQ